MTLFQLFVGLCLVVAWSIRPFLYKPVAASFPFKMSPAFTSTWLVVALLLTFPLLGNLFLSDWYNILLSPFVIIAVYKGISLFYLIKLQQVVNKKSTSSSVFLSFIALALGSLFNNLFLGEGLSVIKVISIVGFGVLGLFFLVKGDARRLSPSGKKAFGMVTIIMASYQVSDHLAIPQIGWYSYLLISSIVMFAVSFMHGISKRDFKKMFLNRSIACAGMFYAASEFLVIYASINILPVSIVGVFLRLAVPIVMIYSAVKYREQSLKNQLTFGVCAFLLALPIILL